MSALPEKATSDLGKILGLLSSNHAGELDAAVLAATRLLQRHGLRWSELLASPTVKREPLYSTWRATCSELMRPQGDLRSWKRKFVADLPAFRRVSSKQRYILFEIAERVLGSVE